MKAVTFALLAASASATLTLSKPREYYEQLFFDHMTQFQLKFSSAKEFVHRLEVFAQNIEIIEKHNADSTSSYKMGVNQFSHLTFQEFLDAVRINGTRPPSFNLRRNPNGPLYKAPENAEVPASVDWTQVNGVVTPVKNQGNCGSCWSFSTTGAMEGGYYLAYKQAVSFSEQQLVSCDTDGDDAGCNGGWMDSAFQFAQKNGGLTTEDQYPYTSGTSGKSGTCQTSGYTNVPNSAPKGFTDVTPRDIDALKAAVAQQPVSIAIQANQLAFQMYKEGVLDGRCGQNLDHGVLLVGYGTENGVDYWKVKNSWGETWGDGGYIKIKMSDENLCGVLEAPSFPVY